MRDLMLSAVTWAPVTLLPVLFLALAPLAGRRFRVLASASLGVAGACALVAAGLGVGQVAELEVINPFFNPELGKPQPFVVETTRADSSLWRMILAVYLLVPGLWLFLRRDRPAVAPCPVVYTAAVTGWTFAARLALEKAAAPEGLTWSVGVTVPCLLVLPFVGRWAGRRRCSLAKLAFMVLLIGLVQRTALVAVGFLATTRSLGTHLDVGAIRQITLLVGHRDFSGTGDPRIEQWATLILIPQYLLWVPFTLVAGLVLGFLPFRTARSRAAEEGSGG